MSLLRHALLRICLCVLSCALSAGCRISDEVVGTVQSADAGPDASFPFDAGFLFPDGGQPACDFSEALSSLDYLPGWITVAHDCQLPFGWKPPDFALGTPDAGSTMDSNSTSGPENGSTKDLLLAIDLLTRAGPLYPQDEVVPFCGNSLSWYLDSGSAPQLIYLCPKLCDETARTIAEKVDIGCHLIGMTMDPQQGLR